MELKDLVNNILPIISIIGTLFVYFYHGHKINQQTKIIQEFEIDKLRFEKEERSKANVIAKFQTRGRARWAIEIKNTGKSEARNVRVSVTNPDVFFKVYYTHIPYDKLFPNSNFDIEVQIVGKHKEKYDVEIIWDDDYSLNRTSLIPIAISF